MKSIIRRNLPLNDNYIIVDSFYTGGMENACTCDNCNKLITNVATIKNSKDVQFHVGLDCAETLTNLMGLDSVRFEFAEMKALVAKANKAKKESEIMFSILPSGKLLCEDSKNLLFTVNYEFAVKYMPQYLKLVSNPEKMGYVEKRTEIVLPFSKFMPRDNKDFVCSIICDKFNCEISVKPYFHMVTNEISGWDFYLDIPELNVSQRVCMYSQITSKIEYEINNYYFNQYHI